MSDEVAITLAQISQAGTPEEIFGALKGNLGQQKTALQRIYRKLAMVIHPDRVTDPTQRPEAEEATRILNSMLQTALKRVEANAYGSDTPPGASATSRPCRPW